jgi:hypothetical protein
MEIVGIGMDVGRHEAAFATADFVVECLEGNVVCDCEIQGADGEELLHDDGGYDWFKGTKGLS